MKKKRGNNNSSNKKDPQLNDWVVSEAARIYVNENGKDLHSAKLKAAARIGIDDTRNLPSNEEVETAIKEYQRLFSSAAHKSQLELLQQHAISAMSFFERFKPRIVGAILNGTAASTATIYLHLFTDIAEEVDWFLLENKIPHEALNKTYYINKQLQPTIIPGYRFIAEESPIELAVFSEISLRQQVRSSPKGQSIERESLANYKRLLSLRND